jgi:alpha-glucan, water dikinase
VKLIKPPEAHELDESKSPASRMSSNKIPEDLVQVQTYIRWEKAGKPNYPL